MSLVTISEVQKHSFILKQSKFISYIRNCSSISDFRSWLSQIKKDYYDASHARWAYRMQCDFELFQHSSDAGEPSGTAGAPILKVLKQNNLIQCGLIVVRYFGGTKLGRKGLIDAYSNAAVNVINNSNLMKWVNTKRYIITCPIKYYGELIRAFQKIDGKIIDDQSGENLNWTVEINPVHSSDLIRLIRKITIGKGELETYKKGVGATKSK